MQLEQHRFTKTVNELAMQVNFLDKDIFQSRSDHKTLKRLGFKAKYKESLLLPSLNQLLIGTVFKTENRTADPYNKFNPYELGAVVYHACKKFTATNIQFESLPLSLQKSDIVYQLLLGFIQASTKFTTYKNTKTKNEHTIGLATRLKHTMTPQDADLLEQLNHGITITRQLIEATPEEVNPSTIHNIIQDVFSNHTHKVQIHQTSYEKLKEINAQGVTSVGRGSLHKPLVTKVTLSPSAKKTKTVILVGKGVTYDSGGLNIKTGTHMKTMKCDMGGAATMLGVMRALSGLSLAHTEVQWISAFAENMIDNNSYKPDDIITTLSGQTVEIINTDAEGRLTLADALTLATLENPDYIIDTATLTGACIHAVTDYYTALMGNDQELNTYLSNIFEQEQERCQEVAMPEILRESLQGDLSDLKNLPESNQAGHITAGLFLSNFINQHKFRNSNLNIQTPQEYSWVHLDIAGSSYNKNRNDLNVSGATGHGVRSLVKFILSIDNE